MKNIKKVNAKILIELNKSNNKLDAFTLYKRLKIEFTQYINAIRNLIQDQLITENNNEIKITQAGINKLIESAPNDQGVYKWKEIPEDFKNPHISQTKLYIPDIYMLDKRSFDILVKKDYLNYGLQKLVRLECRRSSELGPC